MLLTEEFAISDIQRIDIMTEVTAPAVAEKYSITNVEDLSCEALISAGAEVELRKGNNILAQYITEDILKGVNIKKVASALVPDVLALIDGGTLTKDTEDTDVSTEYVGPVMGTPVNRKKFNMKVYCGAYDIDGTPEKYVCFEFKHCRGTPFTPAVKDGEFMKPSYTIKSRPKSGESAVGITFLDALPAVPT